MAVELVVVGYSKFTSMAPSSCPRSCRADLPGTSATAQKEPAVDLPVIGACHGTDGDGARTEQQHKKSRQ